jgi:hypothetical protein
MEITCPQLSWYWGFRSLLWWYILSREFLLGDKSMSFGFIDPLAFRGYSSALQCSCALGLEGMKDRSS